LRIGDDVSAITMEGEDSAPVRVRGELVIQEMTGWENYVVHGRSVYPDTIRALSDDPAQRYETGRKVLALAIGDSGGARATVQGELVIQADEPGGHTGVPGGWGPR
jgi:hypothetical protein